MRPTIQEIAAMPFPASREAVRRWLDPDWCRFDPDAEPREVRVSIDYEITHEESLTVIVLARDAEEAKRLAVEQLSHDRGKVEVLDARISEPATAHQPALPFDRALH
ncbi:hypothetical protein PX554_13630 [Sphingomonas sp. H39-1-10]|uniref:hypothetical protein n=1 Tax=Sphingomonas pollutisoli TaxID=3030829 RepID=UPI0023B9F309|nr:hypothetical protein [Sphingomonas pollutisoli]MDF0489176.1 hypothetical protein [Sphingomonas pollutisoli]